MIDSIRIAFFVRFERDTYRCWLSIDAIDSALSTSDILWINASHNFKVLIWMCLSNVMSLSRFRWKTMIGFDFTLGAVLAFHFTGFTPGCQISLFTLHGFHKSSDRTVMVILFIRIAILLSCNNVNFSSLFHLKNNVTFFWSARANTK